MPLWEDVRGLAPTTFSTDVLLSGARVVSEGVVERDEAGRPFYHGSTLLTVALDRDDLDGSARILSTPVGLAALERSISLHVRLMRIARAEAGRRASPLRPRAISAVIEFHVEGPTLLMDIHVECPLAEPREEPRGADGGSG